MIVKRVDGGKRYSVLIGYRLIEMSKTMYEDMVSEMVNVMMGTKDVAVMILKRASDASERPQPGRPKITPEKSWEIWQTYIKLGMNHSHGVWAMVASNCQVSAPTAKRIVQYFEAEQKRLHEEGVQDVFKAAYPLRPTEVFGEEAA
jgi:hypothetical protein